MFVFHYGHCQNKCYPRHFFIHHRIIYAFTYLKKIVQFVFQKHTNIDHVYKKFNWLIQQKVLLLQEKLYNVNIWVLHSKFAFEVITHNTKSGRIRLKLILGLQSMVYVFCVISTVRLWNSLSNPHGNLSIKSTLRPNPQFSAIFAAQLTMQ